MDRKFRASLEGGFSLSETMKALAEVVASPLRASGNVSEATIAESVAPNDQPQQKAAAISATSMRTSAEQGQALRSVVLETVGKLKTTDQRPPAIAYDLSTLIAIQLGLFFQLGKAQDHRPADGLSLVINLNGETHVIAMPADFKLADLQSAIDRALGKDRVEASLDGMQIVLAALHSADHVTADVYVNYDGASLKLSSVPNAMAVTVIGPADIHSSVSVVAPLQAPATSLHVPFGEVLVLSAASADGLKITGEGSTVITNLELTPSADLSGIATAGGVTVELSADTILTSAARIGAVDLVVSGPYVLDVSALGSHFGPSGDQSVTIDRASFKLTATQADQLSVTGSGAVQVFNLSSGAVDLSGIAVTGSEAVYLLGGPTADVILNRATILGANMAIVLEEDGHGAGNVTLTTFEQANGRVIETSGSSIFHHTATVRLALDGNPAVDVSHFLVDAVEIVKSVVLDGDLSGVGLVKILLGTVLSISDSAIEHAIISGAGDLIVRGMLSVADANLLADHVSGEITAHIIEGDIASLKLLKGENAFSITITDEVASASDLTAIDHLTSKAIDAHSIRELIGSASDIVELFRTHGVDFSDHVNIRLHDGFASSDDFNFVRAHTFGDIEEFSIDLSTDHAVEVLSRLASEEHPGPFVETGLNAVVEHGIELPPPPSHDGGQPPEDDSDGDEPAGSTLIVTASLVALADVGKTIDLSFVSQSLSQISLDQSIISVGTSTSISPAALLPSNDQLASLFSQPIAAGHFWASLVHSDGSDVIHLDFSKSLNFDVDISSYVSQQAFLVGSRVSAPEVSLVDLLNAAFHNVSNDLVPVDAQGMLDYEFIESHFVTTPSDQHYLVMDSNHDGSISADDVIVKIVGTTVPSDMPIEAYHDVKIL